MSDPSGLELVRDLAMLLKRHGPDAFEKLADQLSSPTFVAHLRTILTEGAKSARASGIKGAGRRGTEELRESLKRLMDSDPDKADLLLTFLNNLERLALLPTLRELRLFAHGNGIIPLQAKSRPQAIGEVVTALRKLPTKDLRQILARLTPRSPENSLENWARIIFDKDLRTRPTNPPGSPASGYVNEE